MPKIVTAKGKKFTFNDDVTNEEISRTIDEYFGVKKKEVSQPVVQKPQSVSKSKPITTPISSATEETQAPMESDGSDGKPVKYRLPGEKQKPLTKEQEKKISDEMYSNTKPTVQTGKTAVERVSAMPKTGSATPPIQNIDATPFLQREESKPLNERIDNIEKDIFYGKPGSLEQANKVYELNQLKKEKEQKNDNLYNSFLEANKNTDLDLEEANQEVENKFNQVGFFNNAKSLLKNTWNTLADVNAQGMSFGTEEKAPDSFRFDNPVEEYTKKANQEFNSIVEYYKNLKKSDPSVKIPEYDINKINVRAKEIAVEEALAAKRQARINTFMEDVDDTGLKQTLLDYNDKKYDTISYEDKKLLDVTTANKLAYEKSTNNLLTLVGQLKEYQNKGINPNQEFIAALKKENDLNNSLKDSYLKSHDDYTKKETELGTLDENYDILKRDYGFWQNAYATTAAVGGESLRGLLGAADYLTQFQDSNTSMSSINAPIRYLSKNIGENVEEIRGSVEKPIEAAEISSSADFGRWITNSVIIPTTSFMSKVAAGPAGISALVSESVGNTYEGMLDQMDTGNANYSQAQLMGVPAAKGAVDAALFMFDASLLKNTQRAIRSATAAEKDLIAKSVLKNITEKQLHGIAVMNGITIAKNAIDKYSGVDPNKNLLDGTLESTAVSIATVGMIDTAPKIAIGVYSNFSLDGQALKMSNNVNKLQETLDKTQLTDENRKIIVDQLNIAKLNLNDILKKQIRNISSLSNSQYKEVVDLNIKKSNILENAKKIQSDNSLDPSTKAQIFENLKAELKETEQRRKEIIENGPKLQLENLDPKLAEELRSQAKSELESEAKDKQSTVPEYEIDKRAMVIHNEKTYKANDVIVGETKPAEVVAEETVITEKPEDIDEARLRRRDENIDLIRAEGSTYYEDMQLKNAKVGDELSFQEYKDGEWKKKTVSKVKEIVNGKIILENGKTQDDISSYRNLTAEDAWFDKNYPELTLEKPKEVVVEEEPTILDSQIPLKRETFESETDNGTPFTIEVTTNKDGSRKIVTKVDGTVSGGEIVSKDNTLTTEEFITNGYGEIKGEPKVEQGNDIMNPKMKEKLTPKQKAELGIEEPTNEIVLDIDAAEKRIAEEKSIKGIDKKTSSNVANLTEDGKGNYVFYHISPETLETIDPKKHGTNAGNVTSAPEKAAIGRVGGVSMYYTAETGTESMVKGNMHMVKVPENKVYDFNSDPLNLFDLAKEKFKSENPELPFTSNDQFAQITKLANEKGYEMVVGEWQGKTRAQTTEPMTPVEVKEMKGDVVVKPFENKYESNSDKGYKSVIPESKEAKLKSVYDEINVEKNKAGEYDSLYRLAGEDTSKTPQENITKLIKEDKTLSKEVKDKYTEALAYEPEQRRTVSIVGETVKVENAPKGHHLNVGLLEGRTNKKMSAEEVLSKLPKDIKVISKTEIKGTEPSISTEISRPLTSSEMNKFLEDTKQQAIAQLSDKNGILYDAKRGTSEGWGEFNPELFVMQDGKNLTEIKGIEVKPTIKSKLEAFKSKHIEKTVYDRTKLDTQVENGKKALSKLLPNIKFVVHESKESFVKEAGKNGRGYYDPTTKTIHINALEANARTVAHEIFHSVLLDKVKTDASARDLTKRMIDSISKTLEGNPELKKTLDDFVKNYDENIKSEEKMAELFGHLADGYEGFDAPTKSVIKRAMDRLAKMFGLKPFTESDVVDMLKTLSGKVAAGEEIVSEELKVFNEPGESGLTGNFNIKRLQEFKLAPSILEDKRDFVRNIVKDIDIKEFNGKDFITNMYDYTNAGETDLGNGFKINLAGGKNYVPLMMSLNGKGIGEVSNLAAFNTKAQAETFIRNAKESGADLFAPHSGTRDQSWQFQQHIFAELVDLIVDKKILTNKELIDSFNNSIKGNKSLKEEFNKFSKRYGKKIKNFDSFKSNPKEIVNLLDIENNLSPDLRKALNNSISSNKKFQKTLGISNKEQFFDKISDPMNKGISGGEIVSVVKFDPNTFEIKKTEPNENDHHPSFGWTVLAKIEGVYQPTKFYKSHEVTDSYTKHNIGGKSISIKADEVDFEKKNVSSSAGAIPKVAKFNIKEEGRMQESESYSDMKEIVKDMIDDGMSISEIKKSIGSELGADQVSLAERAHNELTTQPKTTSVKNEVVSAEREVKGLAPVEKRDTYSTKVNYNETKAKVDSGEISPRDLATAIIENPKNVAITSEVSDALAYDRMRLSNEYDKVVRAIVEDPTNPANIIARDRLEKQMEDNDRASKYSGTISSHALLARKNVIKQDYSLDRLIIRYKAETGGKISEDMRAKFDILSTKLQEATAKLEQYESKKADRQVKFEFEKIKRNADKEVRTNKRSAAKESLKSERESLYAKLKEIQREQMNRLSSNPLPIEMVPVISKLAKNLVMDGVVTLEGVVDEIHSNVKDMFEDITKRDIRDALSGYGKFKLPTKDEVASQLREIKSQAKLVSALEDAESGNMPLKTGFSRSKASETVTELRKKVQEVIKQNGINSENLPDEKVWKSSEEKALKALKTRLKNREKELQGMIDSGNFEKKQRNITELDSEANKLKADVERIKNKVDIEIKKERLKNRTKVEKATDFITMWRRNLLLTGVKVLGKLTAAAAQRTMISPIEEITGSILSKLPILSSIAKKAPREGGFNAKAEVKAISQWWKKATYEDMREIVKSGKGTLDLLHGKKTDLPPSIFDFFGQMHQALKQPAKRNEYFRSFEKRLAFAEKNGVDISDPMVQATIGTQAYLDANRAIFMQENKITTSYKAAVNTLERAGDSGKVVAGMLKIILPIVKVPTNFANEITSYSVGGLKALLALRNGIKDLTPDQADYVMRNIKKQSLGAAFIALGYFSAASIGGFYQRGDKRDEEDVQAGGLRVLGVDMPKWMTHTPLLEMLQIGATLRRVQDDYENKGKEGTAASVLAVTKGVVEEVPFARSPEEALKALSSPDNFNKYFRDLGESMINPQLTKELGLQILPEIEKNNKESKGRPSSGNRMSYGNRGSSGNRSQSGKR